MKRKTVSRLSNIINHIGKGKIILKDKILSKNFKALYLLAIFKTNRHINTIPVLDNQHNTNKIIGNRSFQKKK